MKKAILILNDNVVFRGKGIGAIGSYWGELVFNTGMTGYMEALTDPSYAGQILTFTYPLIGNYGTTSKWSESKKIHPVSIVVSELCEKPVHRENTVPLDTLLKTHHVGGISGIDTRALVKIIRQKGTMPAVLAVYENDYPDLIKQVTRKNIQIINPDGKKTVALIDYGLKNSVVEELIKRELKVIIFPATVCAEEIINYQPNGIILSNGPGDPRASPYIHKAVKKMLEASIPMLGICLGHQFLALATGGKIYKLKFGHRGVNHPVIDLKTKKAYLTSQNHTYAVSEENLSKEWRILFKNLNDQTVEGLAHKKKTILSVQFHPEANPGPRDTSFLFDRFVSLL
ncbi:carbamoyl-phosphate synthase small subunit [Candidatus Roizmanbacteria bacterium CG09_land_8_20_14_0_10_41_9]|uniref:Carbamoyl phosphate synthase small chain n=1 Tax=Candidatus Roizmanbacteria bacterium CG09_land_8_20_14_0_10_41_9 TaxID=1974850 RepID=A0A2H0WU25_9BACT|nr:MAG: carbamoyl-phosphate synthase small subunit [Candidatus Roizmanbacteria bacterium CG09_land_8_20_14_0_10_41_9]